MRCVSVLVCCSLLPASSLGFGLGPYSVKPIEEVARNFGYPVERHIITTPDGYVLMYHRIPYGRNSSRQGSKPRRVVLFLNGILLSSASSMTTLTGMSYQLADAGFDVWLGNYRGNTYSRRHTWMEPDQDNRFWDISLHEFGAVDLPAAIDYIHEVTGQRQLMYIGASLGTAMFWVLGAHRPEYMERVTAMVAVAPVARPVHSALINTPARYTAAYTSVKTAQNLGFNELFSYNDALFYRICTSYFLQPVCLRSLEAMGILSGQNWDMELLQESIKYGPSGIPAKVLEHFMQISRARRFQRFDYGPVGNLEHYQQETPPAYNLKNVTCKSIYFIQSDADLVATKEDVRWLTEQLPKRPTRIFEGVNHLTHMGLALDKDSRRLWLTPMVKFLQSLPPG